MMVRGKELLEYLAKQSVRNFTALGSFIGLFAAIITLFLGEEPMLVIVFFAIGLIFGMLRLAAEI